MSLPLPSSQHIMAITEEDSALRVKSIGAGVMRRNVAGDLEAQNIDDVGRDAPQSKDEKALLSSSSAAFSNDDDDIKDEDLEDLDEPEEEPVNLPESTHTLFFTQPVCSYPFFFATSIVIISIGCLVLALLNNLEDSSPDNPLNVPVNVTWAVRISQYMAILIALIMEEEIPTGIHLLRIIPYSSFKAKFPNKSYQKFVMSALQRIILGYIFLVNVFLILAQANGVLDIFYDVLALQFISELDDIAFSLAKMDVIGKRLKRACTAKLFQTEFEKQKFGRSKGANIFLKSIYFVNLLGFLGGMIFISMRQESGYYQCDSITVDFGDAVWGEAIAKIEGTYSESTLVFSTFNGAYLRNGTHAGRPIYQERKKFNGKQFDTTIPAEIRYDEEIGAWIFRHPDIAKKENEPGSWLLRSPDTTEYNLLNVGNTWDIWVGVIGSTQVTYSCMKCNSATDCNLNGECIDGTCKCHENDGGNKYLGPHCEVKLKESCRSIFAETTNTTWSIMYYSSTLGGPPDTLFEEYNRPVYTPVKNFPMREGDIHWLMYTGKRWIYIGFNLFDMNWTLQDVYAGVENYHAFWYGAFVFDPYGANILSDPTTGDNPVGVDWYNVTEVGDQFGPFGALEPLQKNKQVGRGIFSCAGEYIPAESEEDFESD